MNGSVRVPDPFGARTTLSVGDRQYTYYRLDRSGLADLGNVPMTVKILLENVLRNSGRGPVREDEVRALFAETDRAFGGLDILVNNAGVGFFKNLEEMSLQDWNSVIETNLTGVFLCSREAIPRMRKRGGGYIINISSLAGKNAFPSATAYNASKFGLNAMSEALMQEVRYDGIKVTYLMPGSVATHFNGNTPGAEDAWKVQPEDIGRIVLDLLHHDPRTLASAVEIRPSKPPKK